MPRSSSVANRAILAVLLLVGFYLLAFGIAGVLLYIPYAEVVYVGRIHFQVAFFCLAGAFLIFKALFPRREKFVAPGPLLDEREHPRLFAEIRDIARVTGQEMPSEVYLLVEPNAWVLDRKKFLGLGRDRVMGIGLPMLQLLNTSQLRGVLAHEFGHFHSGDTRLGPWVYKTRALIGRTLTNLSRHSSMLQRPFVWYGNAFLRITHAVSRQQEYTADALAATIVGPKPLIDGLTIIAANSPAFTGYWQSEVAQVLDRGYRPPIMAGFSAYVSSPLISSAIEQYSTQQLAEAKADRYDTHPSLSERVEALRRYPEKESEASDAPAIALVEQVEDLERRLLASMVGNDVAGRLKEISWSETGEAVWLPLWREQIAKAARSIAGITPRMLPDVVADTARFEEVFRTTGTGRVPPEHQKAYLATLFGSAVALALIERGWTLSTLPGEAVTVTNGEKTLMPFMFAAALGGAPVEDATMTPEEWRARIEEFGIGEVDLGKDLSS